MRHSLYSDRPQARFGLKSIGKKIYNYATDLYDRLFNKNYSTIKKMEALTANQDNQNNSEISNWNYLDENEQRYKQHGYIGGDTREVRQKYFDIDKELSDSVKSISNRYGLRPEVVASRLAEEGPIDSFVRFYNINKGALSTNPNYHESMYGPQWGLDDIYTDMLKGNIQFTTQSPYEYSDIDFTNEKGRTTYSIESPQWWLGIEGNAAELKYHRDKFKQQFPNISNKDLDAAAAMSFNMGTTGAKNFYKENGYIPKRYYPYINVKRNGGRISLETL